MTGADGLPYLVEQTGPGDRDGTTLSGHQAPAERSRQPNTGYRNGHATLHGRPVCPQVYRWEHTTCIVLALLGASNPFHRPTRVPSDLGSPANPERASSRVAA